MLGSAGEETSRKTLMFPTLAVAFDDGWLWAYAVSPTMALSRLRAKTPGSLHLVFIFTFPVDESWIEFMNLLLRHMRIFLDGYIYSSHGRRKRDPKTRH